ncbi:hypothetical protein MNBD_GAMMA08-366 [hydrothermal vent metagenome]|uniref:Uncharacterized protein n=1 Tax=hydrothermal vent metagenome TaxID=652676 RepID=A0A3B0XNH3_9ZZZZ
MKEIFKHSDGSDIIVTEKNYEDVNALSDEEIESMAQEDEENPPMTDAESKKLKRVNPLPLRTGAKHE